MIIKEAGVSYTRVKGELPFRVVYHWQYFNVGMSAPAYGTDTLYTYGLVEALNLINHWNRPHPSWKYWL